MRPPTLCVNILFIVYSEYDITLYTIYNNRYAGYHFICSHTDVSVQVMRNLDEISPKRKCQLTPQLS